MRYLGSVILHNAIETHLIQGVRPPGRGRVDLDGFDLVRLVVDTDNIAFFQVARFGHFATPFRSYPGKASMAKILNTGTCF